MTEQYGLVIGVSVATGAVVLITLSVVGILGLAGAAAPSAGVALVVGLVDMM